MGITSRTLKTGEQTFLVQKLVNCRRVSKTFHSEEKALAFLAEKEEEAKTFHPNSKEALKLIDDKIVKEKKRWSYTPFETDKGTLKTFRSDHLKLKDKDFILIFNAVPDYERKPEQLKRYKEILNGLRKNGVSDGNQS